MSREVMDGWSGLQLTNLGLQLLDPLRIHTVVHCGLCVVDRDKTKPEPAADTRSTVLGSRPANGGSWRVVRECCSAPAGCTCQEGLTWQ